LITVIKILVILFSSITISNYNHPYYLSATRVLYSKTYNQFQCTSRFFIDDLESLYKSKLVNSEIYKFEKKKFEVFLKEYLKENFIILYDDIIQNQTFVGTEFLNDIIIIYFEYQIKSDFKKITIKNSVLMNHISDQKNIVHLEINDEKKSYLLTLKKPFFSSNKKISLYEN
tara:strand:+ start:1117 stop:1632 length:516 start_codon:yes stop_codon:yes gene_type:complete